MGVRTCVCVCMEGGVSLMWESRHREQEERGETQKMEIGRKERRDRDKLREGERDG